MEELIDNNLTPEQRTINGFKRWARINYSKGSPIKKFWHEIAIAECQAMNVEAGLNPDGSVKDENTISDEHR